MTTNRPIYLDYAATTPTDPEVADAMMRHLCHDGDFGNPASRSHCFGWQAEEAVETARKQIAGAIGADPREIVMTSGATESDNLAIKGAALFNIRKGRHIITSSIEHKAVLDCCRHLEGEGFEVSYLDPDDSGLMDPRAIADAIRDDTTLVSIMAVNNELGNINDIEAIARICKERKVVFHSDAAQAVGKMPVDVQSLAVDLMSLTAHKVYGPKGVGALFVRRRPRVRLAAQIHGGGHERGMRSGTLPTHQIVGMGEAFRLAGANLQAESSRLAALRKRLLDGVMDMEAVHLNSHPQRAVPNIVNISFAFVEGESLLMALKDMAVSSGSACTSASLEPSYVLRALGVSDEMAHSSIRFSLGKYTTESDIDLVVAKVCDAVGRLREMSPLWDMYKDGVDLDKVQWAAH